MAYDHRHFRKVAYEALSAVDDERRMTLKEYMDSIDELVKEKEKTIKNLQEKKITNGQIFIEIFMQVLGFTMGGLWLYAYQNNFEKILIIIVTILFIMVLFFKYKYIGAIYEH